MRLLTIIILFAFFIEGCTSSKITIDNLQMIQNKYYLAGTQKPYSGKVISKFDNGDVSSVIEIKEGVPNGKWIAYGYKNEIVQEGSYYPINVSNETEFMQDSIKRLNICFTKEGLMEFTDVFLITNEPDKKKGGNINSQIIFTFLKNHSIVIKGDTINEIKYVKGELDN